MPGYAYSVFDTRNQVNRIITLPTPGYFKLYSTSIQTSSSYLRLNSPTEILGYMHADPATTIIVTDDTALSFATQAGFTDVLDLRNYSDGDEFQFKNGSKLRVYTYTSGARYLKYLYADGRDMGIGTVGALRFAKTLYPDPDYCVPIMTEAYGVPNAIPTISIGYDRGMPTLIYFRVTAGTARGTYLPSADTLTVTQLNALRTFFDGIKPISDPYDAIPQSGPSTASGTYDFTTSDKISVPALPSLSAVSTGFVSLWSPTEAQMLQLSSFMWNANPLTIEFWKKIVADPMQLIYGLNIVPLDLDALGMIDSTGEVVVGLISTGVSMNHLSGQWVELDCGTVTLDETWSAYLDYDPYTKLEIYLPYCGTHPLRVDDFMPGTVKLTYHIDLLSGACVAILTATKSDKHGDTLDSVVYQFMGNCAAQIPVTASQYADAVRSVIQLAASIGTMIAGAAGAGAAVAAETSALPASAGLAISSGAHQASAMVENVMGIKPNVERSGAIGATGGLLSVQTPYLILTRPRQARPEDQNTYTGYPSFITETLGDIDGWTQIQAIHLEAIPCTADELTEIDELLKSGVIL